MNSAVLQSSRVDSYSELVERLRQSRSDSIILGENAQQFREFVLLIINCASEMKELLRIGIISEGHGLEPQYLISEPDKMIVGLNREICLIFFSSPSRILRREFGSLFYEFMIVESHNVIVVVCEAEVCCLNQRLELLWNVYSDLIIDYKISGEHVRIVTDEGAKTYLTINGRLVV